MLRGVVSRAAIAPLTKGMTSARWMDVPPQVVMIADLFASQPNLSIEALVKPWEPSQCADPIPHAVLSAGQLVIEDGHHRIVRAAMQGKVSVIARVLEVPPAW